MISRQRRYKNARLIVKSKTVLGVDTETEGFDFTCKKLIMFQIGDRERQYVIDTREVDISLRHVLESKDIVKVLHNAKFDYKFIKKWAGISMEEMYDTFLAERVINCGKQDYGYSLARCTERYLGVTLDKETEQVHRTQRSTLHRRSDYLRGERCGLSVTFGRNSLVRFVRLNWTRSPVLRMP